MGPMTVKGMKMKKVREALWGCAVVLAALGLVVLGLHKEWVY